MDVNTGRIIHNEFGDDLRYPASLTKMMTLFMAFELIEQKKLSYRTRMKVSAQAAAQPPSKIGLKVGETIRVIDAIKALVTKSANDVAVVMAEHIAGSEANFARLMTRRARQLGMRKTVFRNASGLPDSRQVTTARDMLKLAVALQDLYPRHYRLFKTRAFTYRGKRYRNHNTLLARVQGVDGIKTGYIRAAGFNLVSSIRRDGKHVVAAVFGGKTGKKRNRRMRALLASSLKKASTRRTRQRTPLLVAKPRAIPRPKHPPPANPARIARANGTLTTPPAPRLQPRAAPVADVAARVGRPPERIEIARVRKVDVLAARQEQERRPRQADPGPVAVRREPVPPRLRQTAHPAGHQDTRSAPGPVSPSDRLAFQGGPASETGSVRAPGTLQDQLAQLLAQSGAADRYSQQAVSPPPNSRHQRRVVGQPASRQPVPGHQARLQARQNAASAGLAPADGRFLVQVGAYQTRREAERQLAEVAARADALVGRYRRMTQEVAKGERRLFRARFAGFDARTAGEVCTELRRRSIDCFVTRAR